MVVFFKIARQSRVNDDDCLVLGRHYCQFGKKVNIWLQIFADKWIMGVIFGLNGCVDWQLVEINPNAKLGC